MAFTYPREPVLLIDDEEQILWSMRSTLLFAGISNIMICGDSREVQSLLERQSFSAIIMDLSMPHITGQELLPYIGQNFVDTPVIVVTAMHDLEIAVECMKAGAFDYLVKPVDKTRLITTIRHSIESGDMRKENRQLKEHLLSNKLDSPEAFSQIISKNENMLAIFRYIEAVAGTSLPVLITGETGTGKELVANALHETSGRPGEFVAVNVAGLDDNMFSDTLFGHKKGAFTGAAEHRDGMIVKATEGTLFLDEIGDLPGASQVKLLRLLQEREYLQLGADKPRKTDARFVFATNRDLKEAISNGGFRQDLYYRLRSHRLHIPPLRERSDDIPLLVEFFIARAAKEIRRKRPRVPRNLYTRLKQYAFPGNIRELEGMIFDAMVRSKSDELSLSLGMADMPNIVVNDGDGEGRANPENDPFTSLADLPAEDQVIQMLTREALRRSNGNLSAAARLLGIDRSTMSKRTKNFQL